MIHEINPAPADELLKGLQVKRTAGGLQVTYRWLNGLGGIFQIINEIVLLLIGAAFFSIPLLMLITTLSSPGGGLFWQQVLIPLAFILFGFLLFYRGLGVFLNKSVFEISLAEFKASSGPLPFLGPKNLSLPLNEIRSAEWKKIGHPSRNRNRSGYSASYDVCIVTTGGQSKIILSGVNNAQYAYSIQGEISQFIKGNRG